MKNAVLIFLLFAIATSCGVGPFGTKVKEPFRGSAYDPITGFSVRLVKAKAQPTMLHLARRT